MVIENEQELASDVESAVQMTVDVPIGNAEPETGEQEPLSTGMPATVGGSQLIVTGNASTDCRSTEGGQDRRATAIVPGVVGVGAVGVSSPQPAVRTAKRAQQRAVGRTWVVSRRGGLVGAVGRCVPPKRRHVSGRW